jgi:hypothetical protein
MTDLMPTSRFSTFLHRHFTWLLWLVLLVPVAQTAATWHVVSHVNAIHLYQDEGQQAIHEDLCDLCLSAAAVMGGAPLVTPLDVFHASKPVEAPLFSWPGLLSIAPARAYESRAPPFLLL